MREAWRQIDQVTKEVRLIGKEHLNTLEAVNTFIKDTESQISTVTASRTKIYNKLRRCTDPGQIEALKRQRNDCTAVLKELRNDIKTAEHILDRNPRMKEEIAIETEMRQELRPPLKHRKRSYER